MKTSQSAMWTWCAGLALALSLVVAAPQAQAAYSGSGTFTQIADPGDITSGGYYVFVGGASFSSAAMGTARLAAASTSALTAVGVTAGSSQVDPAADIVWRIDGSSTGWSIYSETAGFYVGNPNANGVRTGTSSAGADFQFTFATAASSAFTIRNLATTTRILSYNSGSPRFGCYSSAQTPVRLFKMASDSAPAVATVAASDVAATTAKGNGDVTADGGDTVTERGVCYKTSAGVAITDNPTAAAAGGTGAFSVDLSSLDVNQTYYFKAYAQNSVGTALAANELNFTTLASVPAAPTVDNPTASTLDVAINANGNPASTEFAIQRTSDSQYLQTNGSFGVSVDWQTAATWDTTTASGLSSETEYFFQVKARNGANVETAFGSTASETTAAAPTGIWINPMSAGTPMGAYYLGDTMGEWFVNFEIGQVSWDYAQIGIGTSAAGIGYGWGEANWYEDGEGANKRVRRDLNGIQFTSAANYYVICQAKAAAEDDYTSKSGNGWSNSTAYPPVDLVAAYFTVNALNDPSNQSAAADQSTQINLFWSNNVQDHAVMVVRKLAAASWTEPAQGTSYAATDALGAGTVIYKGGAGVFYDTGLEASTAYTYKFYSVNNDYYSPGVTAEETTLSCEPDAPAGLHASETNDTSFTAVWTAADRATGYRLDVSESATFSVAGTPATIFTETMGTVGGTTAISTHETADGFDNDDYTMSDGAAANPGDIRTSSASGGYAGASGLGNVFFTSTAGDRGFSIAGIDASSYASLTLSFGYRKESTSANATFVLEYSTDSGTNWNPITVSGLPAEDAGAAWHLISDLSLPTGAVHANLSLRWVKSGSAAMRIDDVVLKGLPASVSFVTGYEDLAVAGTSQRVEGLDDSVTYYFRVRAEGEGGCPSGNSSTGSVTTLETTGGPQTINFPAIGAQVTTSVVVLAATASSGLDVSFAVLSGPADLAEDDVTLTFTGAGEVSVVANQAGGGGWDPAAPVTNTFNVTKASATVTLFDLAQTYNGSARVVTNTTVPAGLTVVTTYDGSETAPTAVGSYAVTGTVSSAMYQGSAFGTLEVSIANPASFSATAASVSTIDLAFAANAAGNDVVIVANLTGTFDAPSGTPSAVGEAFAGGTVVYVGTNSPQTHSSLSSCTPYSYKAWSQIDGFYSAGLTDEAATAAPDAPANLGSVPGYTDFAASWDAVTGATGYRLDVSTMEEFGTSVVASDLIISEYFEGGSGNNKAIEIFNGTGAPVDLSNYRLWMISNGGNWPESTNVPSGTLAPGEVYVITHSSADYPNLTSVADLTSGSLSFNGDDAVGLAKNVGGIWTLIDAVGEDGVDPGTGWAVAGVANATVDHSLIRKSSIAGPTTNWAVSRGMSAEDSQWILSAGGTNEHAANFGSHAFDGGTTPSFVAGFEDLAVAGTSQSVTGLTEGATYYFRVRAEAGCTSADSATASATTLEHLKPVLSRSSVNVREGGEGRFFVRLNQDPGSQAFVTVARSAGDESLAVQGEAVLTFRPANWSAWQAVTLTAPEDENADGEEVTFTISLAGADDQFVTATTLDDDIADNIALAESGTTISGYRAYRLPELIDGVHNVSTNYGWLSWTNPIEGSVTVNIRKLATVSRIRMLNWDWTYRTHSYKIETSQNGTAWTTLVDATGEDRQGWDDWAVDNEAIQYLRISNPSNSVNNGFCISELEVYGSRPPLPQPEFLKTGVNVREGGEGRFYVRLTSAPLADVVASVTRISGDENIAVQGAGTVTFKAAYWSAWQPVTLVAGEDANSANETATFQLSAAGISSGTIVATALDDDIGANLALAAGGASIAGYRAYHLADVIDGVHNVSTNYAYSMWTNLPLGTMTLDLKAVSTVSRIRLLNWDWTCRVHRYQIESSTDGSSWSLLADASAEDHQGWDDWAVADAQIRYLRLTGLSNSVNNGFCVPEWEVYGEQVLVERLEFSKTSVNVREGGEGRFYVRMTDAPLADITYTVSHSSGDAHVSVQNGATLAFKPSNWSAWRLVTLAADADVNAENETAAFKLSASGVADQFVTATVLDGDIGENLAATGGTTISGYRAYRMEQAIDGIHEVSTNYAYVMWTGTAKGKLTLDLHGLATVSRIRLLNWDWSYRTHRYVIEASTDGTIWTMVADASGSDRQGWDDWAVADAQFRYLRFTGLTNSTANAICIPELEVYGTRPEKRLLESALKLGAGRLSRMASIVGSEPITVLTSDGVEDETGWNAVDGDDATAWVGQQVGGGYLVVEYQPTLELSALEVDLVEGSLTNVQYLYSLDAKDWQPLPDDMETNPVSLNFLWLVFPDDGTKAVPQVLEIVPNP